MSLSNVIARALLAAFLCGSETMPLAADEPPITTVRLSSQKSCFIADIAVTCRDVGAKLKAMQVPLNADIHLSVNASVRYDMTVPALESLTEAGYRKVGFTSEASVPVLTELAGAIARARSARPGSVSHVTCPPHLERLVGLTTRSVSALGKPDFVGTGQENAPPGAELSWSYFLRPRPEPPKANDDNTVVVNSGGGWPVLTFYFDAAKTVVRAECSYAR